jgi:hypothetical protein
MSSRSATSHMITYVGHRVAEWLLSMQSDYSASSVTRAFWDVQRPGAQRVCSNRAGIVSSKGRIRLDAPAAFAGGPGGWIIGLKRDSALAS